MREFWKVLRGRTNMDRQRRAGYFFIAPALLYFLLIYFYPLFQSFQISFYKWSPTRSRYVGLQMYRKVWHDPIFWLTVKNTFMLVLLSVPAIVVLALLVSILLQSIRATKFRNLLTTCYFLPLVTSLVAAGLIWEWIYNPTYGLLNHLLGYLGLPAQQWLSSMTQVLPSLAVINIWVRLGFAVLIFSAALQSIPQDFYDAAAIDGAGPIASFWYLTLPLLNPQIVLVSIIELIFGFKVFDQVFVTTQGNPANASKVIILYLYENAFKWYKLGEASVMAIFLFLFLLCISVLQWRFFRKTVTFG
ncbi:MAG: sugar ABC transporter permease [Nitrospinota bacterium]|nr:MAG: sugar ABC transporter permease [Nitrospinota bacterium]